MTFIERNSEGNFRWSMTACAEKICYHLASHLFLGFLHFSPRAVLLEPGSSAVTSHLHPWGPLGNPIWFLLDGGSNSSSCGTGAAPHNPSWKPLLFLLQSSASAFLVGNQGADKSRWICCEWKQIKNTSSADGFPPPKHIKL